MKRPSLCSFIYFLSVAEYVKSFCLRLEHHRADDQENFVSYSDNGVGGSTMNCSHNITPDRGFETGFFLRIRWHSFTIPDQMPDCKDFYIEVFLTRSYKSIGRFCFQDQDSKLFNMYSYDGYAKITYYVRKRNKKTEYRFSYQMLENQNDYLGSGSACIKPYNNEKTGLIFSSRWPRGDYYASTYPCTHEIEAKSSMATKIIFMDVDLARMFDTCPSMDDYLEVRGSDDAHPSFSTSKLVKKIQCRGITTVTADYNHVFVRFYRSSFNAPRGHRGFVAGYVLYAAKRSLTGAQITGIVIGVVGVLLIAAVFIWRVRHLVHRKTTTQPNDEGRSDQHLTGRQNTATSNEELQYGTNRNSQSESDPTDAPPKYTFSAEPAPPYLQQSASYFPPPSEPPPSYQEVFTMQSVGNQPAQREARP